MKNGYSFLAKKFPAVVIFLTLIIVSYGCYTRLGDRQDVPFQPPQDFNIDELNEYGDWVVISDFGEVWVPSVVDDWEPFYYGHWVYTDDGWLWISYEPFGWVVYHYGYWYYDDANYGWVWIPENDGWSPAVVQWSKYDDYISWAPLPPSGVSIGDPWDEKKSSYWHNVQMDSFMEENVGKFEKGPPPDRDEKKDGGNKDVAQDTKTRTNTNADNNSSTERKSTTTTTRKNTGTSRNAETTAPTSDDIKSRTGKTVSKTKVTKEKSSSNSNLNKVNLPDTEKEKVTKNQEKVEKEVIVPKSNSSSKKSSSSNSSDSKKKTTSRSR